MNIVRQSMPLLLGRRPCVRRTGKRPHLSGARCQVQPGFARKRLGGFLAVKVLEWILPVALHRSIPSTGADDVYSD